MGETAVSSMKLRISKSYPISGREEGKNMLRAFNYIGPMLQTSNSPRHCLSRRAGLFALCLVTHAPSVWPRTPQQMC